MIEKKNYQIVLDQSTSGTKLLLLDSGKIVKRYDKTHRQIYPQPGWVEHDPNEIWNNVQLLLKQAFSENSLSADNVVSLSITNQRETILAWDKISGQPLYNAIVWQCNRSIGICEDLIEKGFEAIVNAKTGLRIDPYFSGTKIKWLYDNIPSLAKKSEEKELAVGTIDSWLIWNLTNKEVFATESSNASRTLLYNIEENAWDDELATIFGAAVADLPEVKKASDLFGHYQGIPIIGVIADSQSALLGEGCLKPGDVKVTMGTGCSIMMQVGEENHLRDERILTTIAWENKADQRYALEGIIRSCADSIGWLNQNIADFTDRNATCNQVLEEKNSEEIYFIPALQGLGAPFWQKDATASFIGMKMATDKYDLLRAVLESMIFQVKSVIDVMEEVAGIKINEIKIDGGVTKNKRLMQLLANLLNKEIIINNIEEQSAFGALTAANQNITLMAHKDTVVAPIKNEQQSIIKKYQKWQRLMTVLPVAI